MGNDIVFYGRHHRRILYHNARSTVIHYGIVDYIHGRYYTSDTRLLVFVDNIIVNSPSSCFGFNTPQSVVVYGVVSDLNPGDDHASCANSGHLIVPD